MPTFKMLRGRHAEGKDENGKQIIHERGSTFASNHDLDRIYNKPNSTKFQRVSDEKLKQLPPTQHAVPNQNTISDGLEDLTIGKLRELAAEEEIDIEGAIKKDDILSRIRATQV